MTAVVGVLCQDGVVLGADSSATFVAGGQFSTIEQRTDKITVVANRVIVAGSGTIGLDQRFCAVVERAWNDKVFRGAPIEVGKKLSRMGLEDFQQTFLKPGQYAAVVAFPCEKNPCLLELGHPDFQPELKTEKLWYTSMGSAQPITDPFLALMRNVFWQDNPPPVAEAIFAVTWTLQHAIEVNPGGVGGPLRIAVLEKDGKGEMAGRVLDKKELEQHEQAVTDAIKHLREFRKRHQPPEVALLPTPPSGPGGT